MKMDAVLDHLIKKMFMIIIPSNKWDILKGLIDWKGVKSSEEEQNINLLSSFI